MDYENDKNYVPDEENNIKGTTVTNGKSANHLYPTLYVTQEGHNGAVETSVLNPDNGQSEDGGGGLNIPNIKLSSSVMKLEQLGLDDVKKQRPTPVSDVDALRDFFHQHNDLLAVRLFFVAIIIIDLVLLIIDLAWENKEPKSIQTGFDIASIVFSTLFLFDLALRIFVSGCRKFFKDPWEVFDAVIIVITFIATIAYTVIDSYTDLENSEYTRLALVARLLRVFRFARVFYSQRQIKSATRRVISQNKRRYQKDGFDLDLTYVTENVIAMSFPSSGSTAIYRNPIEEVARFFKKNHRGKFRIYNLCSERSYNTKLFKDAVCRVKIDDHNVPTLAELWEFIRDAKEWMSQDEDNVIAIHCKGGKGRTGTCVSSWLIESGHFTKAADALEYFGHRRTDFEVGDMFQGVETVSQIRYVGYFEKLKTQFNNKLPPQKVIMLKQVTIKSIEGVGKGNGNDLTMQIIQRGKILLTCKYKNQQFCKVNHSAESNSIVCQMTSFPLLVDDVKIRFTSSDKSVPKGYDNCAFYFWFHTSFIKNNKLVLGREDLDNPHKKKTWNIFKEDFALELLFK